MSDPSGAVTTDALSAAPDLGPAEAPAANPTPTEPQTTTDPASTTATPDAPDWESIKDHPEISKRIKEEVAREADRLAQQRIAKQARQSIAQRATQAVADDDADTALDIARQIPGLLADPDDGASIPVNQKLSALGDDFFATEEYRAAYVANKAALDKVFETGTPQQIKDYVSNHAAERKTAEDKRIAAVAAAIAEQEINKRLGAQPQPFGGASGGAANDDQFIEEYAAGRSNDHARYQRIQSQLR